MHQGCKLYSACSYADCELPDRHSMKIVDKGCGVVKEQPLLCLQTIDSQKTSLCCANCLTFLGDSDIQGTMIVGTKEAVNITSTKFPHREQCIQKACNAKQAFRCTSKSCSEVYCSIECRRYALWSSHGLECAGCSEEMDSTMSEFRAHAYKSEELFLATCRVISTLVMLIVQKDFESLHDASQQLTREKETVQDVREILEEMSQQGSEDIEVLKMDVLETVRWYESCFGNVPELGGASIVNEGDRPSAAAYQLSESACESWLLLHSGLVNSGVSGAVFGPLLSQSFFGTVLQSLERHLHSLQMTANPLPQRFIQLLSSQRGCNGNDPEEVLLRKLLAKRDGFSAQDLAATDKLLLISELNALSTGAGSIAASAAGPGDVNDDTIPTIFNFDARACHSVCMVLVPYCSKHCVHSCIPNVQLSAATSTDVNVVNDSEVIRVELPVVSTFTDQLKARRAPCVELVALRTFDAHAERFALSYVDDSVLSSTHSEYTFQSRQDQLAARFKLPSVDVQGAPYCVCLRCRYEQARITSDVAQQVINDRLGDYSCTDLLNLGHCSMQQSMYDDAKLLYTSLLTRLLGEDCRSVLSQIEDSGSLPDLTSTCFSLITTHSSDVDNDNRVKGSWALAADTFHALGAAFLESGDWRRSRLVWRFGLHVCPEHAHAQLQSEVTKIDCFQCAEVSVQKPPRVSHSSASMTYLSQIVSKQAAQHRLDCIEYDAPCLNTDFSLLHRVSGTGWLNLISTDLVPFAAVSSGKALEQRVFLTSAQQPLLSTTECQYVINATESFAAQAGGWSTSRHYAVPTTDIPVHVVKSTHTIGDSGLHGAENSLLDWFREVFLQRLAPLLAVQFQDMFDTKDPITVAIHDAFVVKYDTGVPVNPTKALANTDKISVQAAAEPSQTYLPLHCDQSSHSFTIALNAADEYEGGGTYFPSLGAVMRPDVGQVLSFPGGSILHGGEPIVRGTRYILAVFAYIAGSPAPNNSASSLQSSSFAACPAKSGKMPLDREDGGICEEVNKKQRVETAGFKDVYWKSQPSSSAPGDEAEPASSHLFSFSF